jgi:RNA polymerase sigma-70 factor (ECF subfamily)
MAALARGETEPLGTLYLRHGNSVLRLVDSILFDVPGAHAEDVCQEVFLTVHEIAPRYQETGKFKSWLMGIAVRKARARRRKSWLRRKLLAGHAKQEVATWRPAAGPDETMEHNEQISRALAQLTKEQREVLLLRAVQGLSGEEIAEALGITLDAVWSRLKRAHQIIRNTDTRVTA